MTLPREFRARWAPLIALAFTAPKAWGLVSLNDGHDKIYVAASTGVTADSNVFTNRDAQSDFVYSTSLSAEYTRRAGWIGVNANVGVGSSHFARIRGQDFTNPTFGLEFTKQSGRTTGSLTFSASRESRADANTGTRNTYWNIPVGLNFKYPIIGTYTLSGSFGYSEHRYVDEQVYASLATYSAALDLFHVLSTERDMIVGYRYRLSETSRNDSTSDNAISVGLNGKLVRGVTGSLRVGYQTRTPSVKKPGDSNFDSWTASGSSTYAINKRCNIAASISKDFSTTATDSSVDTTVLSIDAQYAYNSHWNAMLTTGYGLTQFLGEGGRIVLEPGPPPLLGAARRDSYVTAGANLGYSLNEHFKATFGYSWFKNWSNTAYAQFVRSSWTLNLSSRW